MICLEIKRKIGAEFGAAVGTFIDLETGEVLAYGPMITGPRHKLNPTEYSNITPPGIWYPTQTLKNREHLRGGKFTFSILIPDPETRAEHPKRTYDPLRTDPFMSHYAGSSTGCPSCLPVWWSEYKKAWNDSFNKGLFIEIIDEEDVDLSKWEVEFEEYSKDMADRGK